jgi:hypothetical protein
MADQVYLGTVFINNDADTNGLAPGDVVELDTTLDNAVLKVTGSNSPNVIGVIVVGGARHAQVVVCGFPGQRIRINVSGSASVNRGDFLVSDGAIHGTCKVDNAATPDEVFAVALASKTAGVGNQVEALFLSAATSNATGSGASSNAYYVTTQNTNAPPNAVNLGALPSGLLSLSVSGGVATLSTVTAPPVSVAVTDPISTTGGSTPTIGLKYDNSTLKLNGSNQLVFRQSAALSVVGNSTGSTAQVLDISATPGSGGILREAGGVLAFGAIPESSVTNLVTDLSNKVNASRTINTTTPLAGGGALSSDLTLTLLTDATLTVIGSSLSRAAITGDVAIGSGSDVAALLNIPNDTTMAGDLLATAIVAPGTPTSGRARLYVDSTSLNFAIKNASGIVNHGVQTSAAPTHQFAISVSDAGVITYAQPTYADIAGAAPGITQLTGDVIAGPGVGSVVATLTNIPNDVTMAGDLLATAITAPATPSAGHARIYFDSTSQTLAIKNSAGIITHGARSIAPVTHQFITSLADDGSWILAQPAATDITGLAAIATSGSATDLITGTVPAARFPALTGDVTTTIGTTVTTIATHVVTASKFRQSAALSVVGNATNALADVVDIAATTDGQVLQRAGSTLVWSTVPATSVIGTANTVAYFNSGGILSSLTLSAELTLAAGTLSITANSVTNSKLSTAPAISIKGNATNVTATVQDVTATGANQVPVSTSTGWTWTTVPIAATNGIVANWPANQPRYFAVDGINGNDANIGYSDVSLADAGTKAVATIAALVARFPSLGAGRTAIVGIRSGTYSDSLSLLLSGVNGYAASYPLIRATDDVASANAVAFADNANDAVALGAVTATGMNAAGYTPKAGATTATIPLTKVGGADPGFPAEATVPIPLGARIRFSATTATVTLRNVVRAIVQITGTDTVTVPVTNQLPATPTTSDLAFIEMPGVNIPSTTITGLGGSARVVGLNFTNGLTVTNSGGLTAAFTHCSLLNSLDTTLNLTASYTHSSGGITCGGIRVTAQLFAQRTALTVTTAAIGTTLQAFSCNTTSVNGNTVIHDAWLRDCGYGAEGNFSGVSFGGNGTDYVRIVNNSGGMAFSIYGTRCKLGQIKFSDGQFAHAFDLSGRNDVIVNIAGTVTLSGTGVVGFGQPNSTGWRIKNAVNSTITFLNFTTTSAYQVTGADGDFSLPVFNGVGFVPSTYTDLVKTGSFIDLSGNKIIFGSSNTDLTQPIVASIPIEVSNDTGTDIPAGRVVQLSGGGGGISLAQGDTEAHVAGALAITITAVKNGSSTYRGYVSTRLDGYPPLLDGAIAWPNDVFVSATVPGAVTAAARVAGQPTRRIGHALNITTIRFEPEQHTIYNQVWRNGSTDATQQTKMHVDGTTLVVSNDAGNSWTHLAIGSIPESSITNLVTDLANKLTDPGSNGIVVRTALAAASAGSLSGVVTTTGSSLVTSFTANAVTNSAIRQSAGLSVIGNSSNASANVADITATATGQVLQNLGTTIGWAALNYSNIVGTPTLYYQTLKNGSGVAQVQQPNLKFSTDFSIANASPDSVIALTTQGGVTPGSYANTNLTVNSAGIITAITSGSSSGTFYQTVLGNNIAITQRAKLNFNAAFTVTDNGGSSQTDVTLVVPNVTQIPVSDGTKLVGDTTLLFTTATHTLTAHHLVLSNVDTSNVAIALPLVGTQAIVKTNGSLLVGTNDVNTVALATNGVSRLVVNAAGPLQFTAYSGGILKTDSSGNVGLGTAGTDYIQTVAVTAPIINTGTAANPNIGLGAFPTPSLILVSSGATTMPVGDNAFSFDTVNHQLILASSKADSVTLALTKAGTQTIDKQSAGDLWLGTSIVSNLVLYTSNAARVTVAATGNVTISNNLTINGLAPNSLVATDGSRLLTTVTIGGGLTFSGGVLSATGTGTAFYQTITAAGVPLTQHNVLNFFGGLTATDDSGSGRTDVTADLSIGKGGGQSVIGGTSSGEALTIVSNTSHNGKIFIGNSGTVGVFDEGTGKTSLGQTSVDAHMHVVMANDTANGATTSWNDGFAVFGLSGSSGTALGISTTNGTSVNISALSPNVAWRNLRINANSVVMYSGGSIAGFFQDTSGNIGAATLSAGGVVTADPGTGQLRASGAIPAVATVNYAVKIPGQGAGTPGGFWSTSSSTPEDGAIAFGLVLRVPPEGRGQLRHADRHRRREQPGLQHANIFITRNTNFTTASSPNIISGALSIPAGTAQGTVLTTTVVIVGGASTDTYGVINVGSGADVGGELRLVATLIVGQ